MQQLPALVTKAERSRSPRGFAALSPDHHLLGWAWRTSDATGAERHP
jgi:hypothetical protein